MAEDAEKPEPLSADELVVAIESFNYDGPSGVVIVPQGSLTRAGSRIVRDHPAMWTGLVLVVPDDDDDPVSEAVVKIIGAGQLRLGPSWGEHDDQGGYPRS
jgi:hypothetical protein